MADTLLARTKTIGALFASRITAPPDADIGTSEVELWWDPAVGAPVLKLKGKDSAGTFFNRTFATDVDTGLLIPKSIVDAKGDLIVGTAADTVGRLAVGPDGQMLVAESAEGGGVKWRISAPFGLDYLATIPFFQNVGSITLVAANDAIYMPVVPHRDTTIDTLRWGTGGTSAGNYDIGLFAADGTALWRKGSTAYPGANTPVTETITSQALAAGTLYYVGFAASDVTATFRGLSLAMSFYSQDLAGTGLWKRETSGFPLPATANLATAGSRGALVVLGE